MTSPIGGLSALTGLGATGGIVAPGGVGKLAEVDTTGGTQGAGAAQGADFGTTLSNSLQTVQDMQQKSNDLSVQAATGTLTDVHDYMIASAESGIATSLTVAVRNKAIEAFQEIMRLQA